MTSQPGANIVAGMIITTATPGGQPSAPASSPARVSEEQFSRMSAAERIAYCRQFAQPLPDGKR
jgi:hypothetical protein